MNFFILPKSIPHVAFAHTYATNKMDIRHEPIRGFIEITYIEVGTAFSQFEDGYITELPPESVGCMLYLQRQHSVSYGRHRHSTVAFEMNFELADDSPDAVPLFDAVTDAKFVADASKIIHACTRDIMLEPENSYKLSARVLELFGLYKHRYDENKLLTDTDVNYSAVRYVKQAKEYILRRIADKLTVADISNALGLSRGYLSEIFKSVCGISIVRYINDVRLEFVKNLVVKESATLAEACEHVGLNDPNYVSRMFKKYYGMSLTEIINKSRSRSKD